MSGTGDLSQVGIMEGVRTALTPQGLRGKQEQEVESRPGKLEWRGKRRRRKRGLRMLENLATLKTNRQKLVKK